MEIPMKALGVILVGLCFCSCSAFEQWSDNPANMAAIQDLSQKTAEQAALAVAERFQVTDAGARAQLTEQAKATAAVAVNQAVARFEAQDKVSRAQWREQTKAQIAASLQGIGGALTTTGNPILIGLGLLMGVGGVLTSKKKEEKTA